ncbi:MAG TPA: hypothetical protein DIT28_07005 [Oxalobacteraceae bacterium]|nr:hypothetical protein [Oxalobacteraceae bacterium]
MLAFSRTIAEIYDASVSLAPLDFPAEAIRALRRIFIFDSCILASGNVTFKDNANFILSRAHVHGRDPILLDDYAQISASDPVTQALVVGLDAPIRRSCFDYYKFLKRPELLAFRKQYELKQLLLFGHTHTNSFPTRLLALYRGTDSAFTEHDLGLMHALWPHLARAIAHNLQQFLAASLPKTAGSGFALMNKNGNMEVPSLSFEAMVKKEWATLSTPVIPRPAWSALLRDGIYEGRLVRFKASMTSGLILCMAEQRSVLDRLSPSQRDVAAHFASGLDYRKISSKIGIAPNTVRNHISKIYEKLDVHDKVSLSLLLRERM